ncbi:hypothetical protein CHLNCDRAFT_55083 [Chlorella variabilis]|uniref:Uncharacterized protein n=1 Tax=Chlorella variabilis TaxID=554065 RepID=E1ZRQ9_CHLVA|nr:hypothetical protein CHLNCDRAFT_55083 [Chlorella variabilis]EFN51506.1 hypothetical protein CHLNCDRAFT_55083 [Chlorella variabilis]|eukprot:XP_005843608.1 hypothetical protein CHLNCDRAFT_55083 [Chlorella variabilis]
MATAGPKQSSIPFSTHARGVPLFDKSRFFDLPRHVARMLLDFRDISSALFWFLSCQTWLTLWSFLITLISVCFFSFFENNGKKLAAQLDWVLICSVAVLPTVGFLWIAYLRRERALDELAKAKVLMMGIFVAHRDWVAEGVRPTNHMAIVQEALAMIVDAMHAYFLPVRFYSRYYPYMGFRSAMVHIALERTRQLHHRNQKLHLSIQRMANIKEFRTPQLQMAVTGLVNVTISLEGA